MKKDIFSKMASMSERDLDKIIANPFYCLTVHEDLTIPHKPLITEQIWIEAAMKSIAEDRDGGKKFLTYLVSNLKGKFV